MFMRTKTHSDFVERIGKHIQALENEATDLRQTNYALDRAAAKFRQERDDARTALGSLQHQLAAVTAELAPLKAARERANANLAAANAKRRARAVANDAPLPPAA